MNSTTMQLAAKMIEVGDVVFRYGYRWQVKQVTYQQDCNGGSGPRFVFTCDALDQEDHKALGYYAIDMTLGFRPDALVLLERSSPAAAEFAAKQETATQAFLETMPDKWAGTINDCPGCGGRSVFCTFHQEEV